MTLDKAMENLKFDSRLTEYNLQRGLVSQQEWKKHLENLPDLVGNILQTSPNGVSTSSVVEAMESRRVEKVAAADDDATMGSSSNSQTGSDVD